MVNIKDLLGEDANLQDLLLDAVEEGDVFRLNLSKAGGLFQRKQEMKEEKSILL